MSHASPHKPATDFSRFLRIESPLILTKEETADLLRTNAEQSAKMPTEALPPAKIVDAGKRSLVFPMPGLSPHDLLNAFSDHTRYPRIEVAEELKRQTWFNAPTAPAWVSCDLALYPNDGSRSASGHTVPNAAVQAAIMILGINKKLPPVKAGFATLGCSTVTENRFHVYLCLHNGLLRFIPISRTESRRHSVLKVALAT